MTKLALLLAILFAIVLCVAYAEQEYEFLSQEEMDAHAKMSMDYMMQRKRDFIAAQAEEALQSGTSLSSAIVDYSQYFSTDLMKCLRNNGFVSAIPRGYQSLGRVDPNMAANVANARAAGFSYVDVYAFPCPTCGNAAGQFNELWNAFIAKKVNIGMVWFDIEGTEYWGNGQAASQLFAKQWLDAAARNGAKIGIYSSKYQWNSIFGTNFSIGSNYPMWYAHYDGDATCRSFSPFGGWNKPTMKQYIGDTVMCGGGIDISSYC